jgi:hypothetical protein
VLLEQAFTDKETERKQIVDIVILCYEKVIRKTESLARITLSNQSKGELKQIFLIENKIREGAIREEQLYDQYTATVNALNNVLGKSKEELSQLISVIFVSPYGEKSIAELKRLENKFTIPRMHIYWSIDEDMEKSSPTMTEFLKAILIQEANGDIDSIAEYTKSTIKSFIQFVENGFKSIIEEELESQTVRDVGCDFDEYKRKYPHLFSESGWLILEQFQSTVKKDYDDLIVSHTPTGGVAVFLKDRGLSTKIFSLPPTVKNLSMKLFYRRDHVINQETMGQLINEFQKDYTNTVAKEEDIIQIRDNNLTTEKALDCFRTQYTIVKKVVSQIS